MSMAIFNSYVEFPEGSFDPSKVDLEIWFSKKKKVIYPYFPMGFPMNFPYLIRPQEIARPYIFFF